MGRGECMCTELQLHKINKEMEKCYQKVYGTAIYAIFLYGSYARGDYDEESDIDYVAVVHGDRLELQEKLKEIWSLSAEIGLNNDVIISPVVIPYNEFTEYQEVLPFYNNIKEEGKRIG